MKNIICFAAHPDDLEFSCTGILSKLKSEYQIFYVIVTNGENGFKIEGRKTTARERIMIRKKEQSEVGRRLGIKKILFLDYKDSQLEYTQRLLKQLITIIRKYKPSIIFSFDPANRRFENANLAHRDHRILAETVFDACFFAKNSYVNLGETHRVEKIYFFGSDKPNYFEDITELIDFKLELLACHHSQFPDFSKVADFVKNNLAKQTRQYEYSESFRILELIPIT
jgi:LmbE family N-acetylglucosaminyl deacetylase